VRIKEGGEWKAAFWTNRGMFEPLVMFFGLTNSPATFQTMMNDIFTEMISEGVVVVYLDNILIFTKDLDEHQWITHRVLGRLVEHQLYLRPEKCEFEKTRIEYLGLIISENRVEMDLVKVVGVADWPKPSNKREVQSFLGFANFYQRFIKDFFRTFRFSEDKRIGNFCTRAGDPCRRSTFLCGSRQFGLGDGCSPIPAFGGR